MDRRNTENGRNQRELFNGSYRVQFLPWKGVRRENLQVTKRGPSNQHLSRILRACSRIDDTLKVKALMFWKTASLEWLYTSTGSVVGGHGSLSIFATEGLPGYLAGGTI